MKYDEISKDMAPLRVARAVNQLHMARVIRKVVRTAANGLPLSAGENSRFFKLLFLDVGLVSPLLNTCWQVLQEDLMLRERARQKPCEVLSIDAEHRGGSVRSSDEVSVMEMERRC